MAMSMSHPLDEFEWMSEEKLRNYVPIKDATEEEGFAYNPLPSDALHEAERLGLPGQEDRGAHQGGENPYLN